jgi:hypothetical protein
MDISVGNLRRPDIRPFSGYGSVAAIRIVMDHETGRSRGCGFVEVAGPSGKPRSASWL